MYEQLNRIQFEEIMMDLEGQDVWVKLVTDCVTVDLNYSEFEFLIFPNTKMYQLGHLNYDDYNSYQNIMIDIDNVADIHRNYMFLEKNTHELILTLLDETQIIVECNC